MKNFAKWITARLSEPSSMASIAALGALQAPNMPEGPFGYMIMGAVYLMIAFGLITPENGNHNGD